MNAGREGSPATPLQWGATSFNVSLQRKYLVYNLFCRPECKEDFESDSVLDKRKNKYDVNNNILEDFADIPVKLSVRIVQNFKDLDGEEDSEHEYDPKKEFDSEEEIYQLCHNTKTDKLLITEHLQFHIFLAEWAKGSC